MVSWSRVNPTAQQASAAILAQMFEPIRDDLEQVEREFVRHLESHVALIPTIGHYIQQAGGKRIRPAVLLMAARMSGYTGEHAPLFASVIEFIHTATLVHDDIIDEARTRRGRPSANTQWGSSKCVLAGDWLYMQAFKIAVQERNFRILDTLIELTQQMVEGELLQLERLGKLITLDEHFDLIFRKTACLFSVCMRLGAILGGASPEQEQALGKYGHDLGMAFQIVDDVLDLTASEDVLGKPVASDLREGKLTMAVIHAVERCTPEERAKIETILQDRAFNGVTHAHILEILQRYGSLEAATAEAVRYAESAQKAICHFPDCEIKRALQWAPEFVVAREK
jgi:octaprenyl-diphosphate synthase